MRSARSSVLPAVLAMAVAGGTLPALLNPESLGWEARSVAPAGPFRESSLLEQWAAVSSGFIVKPIYTLLSLGIVVALWRRRSPDLAALCWAFVFFFIGENFCAANYLVYSDRSRLFEYLHSLGMVLCFAFASFAIFEGLDLRLVRLSEPDSKCAAVGLCHGCMKASPEVPCGLKRAFLFFIPALAVLAFVPLSAMPEAVSYDTRIFGTPYTYSHPLTYQVFEIRFCPGAALLFLCASFIALKWKRREPVLWSKVLFAAGLGALGFSFLRLLFFSAFRENLAWFGFWEEVTELVFAAGAAFLLWVFRGGLFREKLEGA